MQAPRHCKVRRTPYSPAYRLSGNSNYSGSLAADAIAIAVDSVPRSRAHSELDRLDTVAAGLPHPDAHHPPGVVARRQHSVAAETLTHTHPVHAPPIATPLPHGYDRPLLS